ncbi:MAG: hypothetical protein AB7S92_14505 [Parvibaculaceae bacterium]
MFTKVLVAAAALTAAAVTTAPAEAKTNIGIGIGLGLGGGYYGGYEPDYYPVYDGISCWKAKKIVQNHGFHKVYATDCGGKIMGFKGKKSGDWYRIKINRWGSIVDVDEI